MALRIIEGVPGAGKTLYAVRHLAKRFFKKDVDGVYQLEVPCTLITNIEGFVPGHIDLDKEIDEAGGVEKFFAIDYQREYKTRYKDKIVYVVDEAQMKFRKGSRNLTDVFSYFEYHRHWGHDIYLVTQNTKKLPPDIVQLVEHVVVASPRVRSLAGEFTYNWMDGKVKVKHETIRPSKAIFDLYTSMTEAETEKIRNPIIRSVALVLVASAVVLFSGYWFIKTRWSHASRSQDVETADFQSSPVIPVTGRRVVSSDPAVKPVSLVHYIPLNVIEEFSSKSSKIFFFWQDDIFSLSSFPYNVVMFGTRWYVELDDIIFSNIYDIDNPPDDQIIQVKT